MNARLHLVEQEPPAPQLLGGAVYHLGPGAGTMTDLEPESLAVHRARFGPRPNASGTDGDALLTTLEAIGLTGRGGAHFPVATKWRAVRAAGAEHGSVVVANGAESEPLSAKDAALLELRPHLVLDGLVCAAEALYAQDVVVWLHEGAHAARAALTRAIAERAAAHLPEPPLRVVLGPGRYLSGESSAIVRALSGGPALPAFRREAGQIARINGRAALVQNVETLARVAVAAYDGADTATTLLTVTGPSHRAVLEVATSTRLREPITAVVGATQVQAVLVGGYGGSWAPWAQVSELPATDSALRPHGLSLGAGVLLALPAGSCGLHLTAEITTYLAESSARQCGPCLFGLRAVADLTAELAARRVRRRDTARLRRFLTEISGRGGCHHPDGAVRMVASAMATFAEDVSAHLHGRCLHEAGHRGRRG